MDVGKDTASTTVKLFFSLLSVCSFELLKESQNWYLLEQEVPPVQNYRLICPSASPASSRCYRNLVFLDYLFLLLSINVCTKMKSSWVGPCSTALASTHNKIMNDTAARKEVCFNFAVYAKGRLYCQLHFFAGSFQRPSASQESAGAELQQAGWKSGLAAVCANWKGLG